MKLLLGQKRKIREKRNHSAFDALIASPAAGNITLPASVKIFLRSVAGCAAETTAATFSGRTIKTPLLVAGGRMSAGYVGRGVTLSPAAGFDTLIDSGLGKLVRIGT